MATTNAVPLGKTAHVATEFDIEPGEYRTLSYFGDEQGVIYVEKQNSDNSWNNVKGGALSSGNTPFDLRADGHFRFNRPESEYESAADFD